MRALCCNTLHLQHAEELDGRRLLAVGRDNPSRRLIQHHVVLFGQLPRNEDVLNANRTISTHLLSNSAPVAGLCGNSGTNTVPFPRRETQRIAP